jgi:hypothetical protein
VAYRLYLPEAWASEARRVRRPRPEDVPFQSFSTNSALRDRIMAAELRGPHFAEHLSVDRGQKATSWQSVLGPQPTACAAARGIARVKGPEPCGQSLAPDQMARGLSRLAGLTVLLARSAGALR